MNQETGLWPHHRSLIWLQLLLTRHGEHLYNGIRCDGLHRGSTANIHTLSCALALPPLKIPRDSISFLLTGQLNTGSAGQLTWRPNFRWFQTSESSTLPLPCSFFLLQLWQNNSLVRSLYCHKPAPCLQPSQWPAHMHSLAFHLGAASRELRFIKPFSWAWVLKSRPSVGGRTGLVHMGPIPTHQAGTYSCPASLTPCKRQQKYFWALCWHLMPPVFLYSSQKKTAVF